MNHNDHSQKRKRDGDEVDNKNEMHKKPRWQLQNELASWASTYKTKADSFTALLKVLRQYDFPHLKSDSRSVLNTPRDTAKLLRNVEPGQYVHIGIEEGVQYTLKQNLVDKSKLECIVIDYNTDGVQITDSTDNVFWPIWCRISTPRIGGPFLVGNYWSYKGQPKEMSIFLEKTLENFV